MYTLLTSLYAVCPTHVILPTTGLHSCKIHGWQDRAHTGNFGVEETSALLTAGKPQVVG